MLNTKVTLLIVDNDPSIRYSLGMIFRCKGYSVRSVEDGFGALQEMAVEIPDILLSDLSMSQVSMSQTPMSETSGLELLSVVRRRFPSIYVIAMSVVNRRGGIPQGIAADGFYEKGSGVTALFQAVKDGVTADRLSIGASRKPAPNWDGVRFGDKIAAASSALLANAVGRFRLVELGINSTGFGRNDGWGDNHSDEGEGNQNIMHCGAIS